MLEPFSEKQVFLREDGSHRYSVKVPDFMCSTEHFNYDHWEKDRFASMEANLHKGDTLFDIGSELGWMSVIFAGFVGAENMCLFEAVSQLWPNIERIWRENNLATPKSTCLAFVSRKTTVPKIITSGWPEESKSHPLEDLLSWTAIHSDPRAPQICIDDFIKRTGIAPSALTVDIEGGEMWALQGAKQTLLKIRPLVWASLHPDLRLQKFGTNKQAVRDFMNSMEYLWQYLGVDHEEHYFFYPKESDGAVVLVEPQWRTYNKRELDFETCMPDWKDIMPEEGQTWMHE